MDNGDQGDYSPHSGGEYYSENLIVTNFHIILREVLVLGIHIIVWNAEHCKS